MRSNNDAPVDTMGCHMSMDKGAAPEVRSFIQKYVCDLLFIVTLWYVVQIIFLSRYKKEHKDHIIL